MSEYISVYLNTSERGPAGADGADGAGSWGAIEGTLSDQTDLQAALDAKAASSHTHTASALRTMLGMAEYATQDLANAALNLGDVYYNTTDSRYEVATA